ncbi:MAG TPA: hypothetical protein VKG24_31280 [Pseudolabrys sp.]|nr:hypothetical protein [Pseudolabrys sp.]
MTTRKPVQLSYEALHRIRLAAGGWPADMEIYELGRQLSKAIYDYQNWRRAPREINAQKTRLKAIRKHAHKLAVLLRTNEENPGLDWCSQWPKDWPPPIKVAEEIQRLVEESAMLETSPQKIIREIKDDNAVAGSAFDWLAGKNLPEVFEQFFRDDPTVYRDGRYSDFVAQVLTEFEIKNDRQPYSRESIVKALTLTRSGRSRRHRGQK